MSVEIAYVSMVESLDGTGESLFQAMKPVLEEVGLDLGQCFGFASNRASTMMGGGGDRSSVWTRMQAASPNCTKLTCICHRLALCTQNAFEKLSTNLGFLLKEVTKWCSECRKERVLNLLTL